MFFKCLIPKSTSVTGVVVGPSVNPLQNRETQHVNIVLQCMYWFFEHEKWKVVFVCGDILWETKRKKTGSFVDGFYNNFRLQLTLLELQCVCLVCIGYHFHILLNLFSSLGVEYLWCNLSRYVYLKVQLILAWIINVEAKFVGCIGCHLPNFSDACHAFVHTVGVPFTWIDHHVKCGWIQLQFLVLIISVLYFMYSMLYLKWMKTSLGAYIMGQKMWHPPFLGWVSQFFYCPLPGLLTATPSHGPQPWVWPTTNNTTMIKLS